MVRTEFVRKLPKIELHVHLEGSIRPETVLKLAKRNGVELPADSVEGLREWYRFKDFPHFIQVYIAISKTIKTDGDIELIAREFLEGQAEQNILHSEVTYTACTIKKFHGIEWPDQLAALNRAREYGEKELGVTMGLILDIVRGDTREGAMTVSEWAVGAHGNGVIALGLAGEEHRGSSGHYREAFEHAHANGLPIVPHAGETQGAWSVKECLRDARATRIGHGVRSVEDPEVVQELIEKKVTLEVCPSSNVCLGGYASMKEHVLPELIRRGVKVTINSDDPPMFNTTLTEELLRVTEAFDFGEEDLRGFQIAAAEAALVSPLRREELLQRIQMFNP